MTCINKTALFLLVLFASSTVIMINVYIEAAVLELQGPEHGGDAFTTVFLKHQHNPQNRNARYQNFSSSHPEHFFQLQQLCQDISEMSAQVALEALPVVYRALVGHSNLSTPDYQANLLHFLKTFEPSSIDPRTGIPSVLVMAETSVPHSSSSQPVGSVEGQSEFLKFRVSLVVATRSQSLSNAAKPTLDLLVASCDANLQLPAHVLYPSPIRPHSRPLIVLSSARLAADGKVVDREMTLRNSPWGYRAQAHILSIARYEVIRSVLNLKPRVVMGLPTQPAIHVSQDEVWNALAKYLGTIGTVHTRAPDQSHAFDQTLVDPAQIAMLSKAIGEFMDAAQKVANFIGSHETTTTKKITCLGFESLNSIITSMRVDHIARKHFYDAMLSVLHAFGIDPSSELGELFLVSQWGDQQFAWHQTLAQYSPADTSNYMVRSTHTYFNETGDPTVPDYFHLDLTFSTSDFQLTPDILIIHKQVSRWGGAYTKDSTYIEPVPKHLSLEETEVLKAFFDILTFANLGRLLGLPVVYPPVPHSDPMC